MRGDIRGGEGEGNVFLSHDSKIIKIYKTVTQVQELCRSNKKEEEKPLGFFSSFFFFNLKKLKY